MDVWIEGRETAVGVLPRAADKTLSGAADAASSVRTIRDGIIRGASIGSGGTKWTGSIDPKSRQKVKAATLWQLREVSAGAVPADQGATFRGQECRSVTS